MKHKMYKTVYIYTTNIKKTVGRYKVGKADRKANSAEEAAVIRIKEQFTAGNRDEKVELIHVYDVEKLNLNMRSIDLEGKFHKILKKQGYGVGGEWFETKTTDPIFTAYNEITTGKRALNNYKPREEQTTAINQAYEYFTKSKGNMFLYNAIMRYGKCFTSYQLMKKLEAKKILVLTYKPAVRDSWEGDLNHVDFVDEYTYFDAKNFSKHNPIKINKGILFSSFQDILGKNIIGDIKDKWKLAMKDHYDLVIIDEVHYGFASQKAQELIGKLNYSYRLDLSGTPINLLNSGYYDEDQIFNWTYIDEQKKKNANPEDEAYKWLPKLNMFTYRISEEVHNYVENYEENEYQTLNKLFGAIDENRLKNDAAVQRFLDDLTCPDPRSKVSPFSDDNIVKHLKHMFWYLGSVNATKALKKKLETHSFFSKFKIIVAAGNNNNERGDTLDIVQNAIAQVDLQIGDCKGKVGTITLSCGKLNTGVSIKKWHSVFFLNELASVQTYWQAAFRSKTPDKDNQKTNAYIFDFNPNRALNMAYSFAEEVSNVGQSNMDSIRELLDTMNWMAYKGNELVQTDPNELLKQIVTKGTDAENIIRKFSTDWLFSKSKNIDERIPEILDSLSESKINHQENIIITNAALPKGKTSKSVKTGITISFEDKDEKEIKNEINKLVNKARTVTNALPTYLFTSDKREENVNDIINSKILDVFKDICGIDIENFKILVESGFINKNKLNKAIEGFNISEPWNIEGLTILEQLEKRKKFIKKGYLNSLSNQEVITPVELVEEMLDKLPKEIWKNKKITFVDPCSKSGIFILEIIIRLMKNLDIKDETLRYEHIINNIVRVYVNKEHNKCFVSKVVYGSINEVDRIELLDINKIKIEDMPKFDVVIGNPPYQPDVKNTGDRKGSGSKIWHKFIELSFNITKDKSYICLITPAHWRLGSFSPKSQIRKAQSEIWKHNIKIVKNANNFFGGIANHMKLDYWIIEKGTSPKHLNKYPTLKNNKYYPTQMNDDEMLTLELFMKDFSDENIDKYSINIPDHRYYNYNVIRKKKKGDNDHPFQHANTFAQMRDDFYDWYSEKTEGFDDKKVIVNSSVNLNVKGNKLAFYDDGKLGTGHTVVGYKVDSKEEGKKLVNFLNNSNLIRKIINEFNGPGGYGVPLGIFKNIPKTFVDKFNNGEYL